MTRWCAIYCPYTLENHNIRGFKSKKECWNYILDNLLCSSCTLERQAAIRGEMLHEVDEDGNNISWPASLYPGCTAEWEVVKESEFSIMDLKQMKALNMSPSHP